MQKISTHLWFDKEAKEAAAFYTSIFKNSRIKNSTTLHDTPSGSVDIVDIELAGQQFTLLAAGPLFKFNPSISFLVSCETASEVDALWRELSKNGTPLLELGKYPHSERYGWVNDRYGLSWQLMLAAGRPIAQKITPVLMFVGKQAGNAENAIRFYTSLFRNSNTGQIMRYGNDAKPDKEGTIKFANFTLEGQQFAAMDSARTHDFAFNEAISLMVHCDAQKDVDYYWDRLSADPKAEQCGWLKDKFGLSWQVVPTAMDRMLASRDPQKIARVTKAFLQMKKFDIARLEAAYEGRSAA